MHIFSHNFYLTSLNSINLDVLERSALDLLLLKEFFTVLDKISEKSSDADDLRCRASLNFTFSLSLRKSDKSVIFRELNIYQKFNSKMKTCCSEK